MPGRRSRGYAALIDRARDGQNDCLGELLEQYRNYLYVVARTQIDLHLSVRASPSDVVQETFLRATKQFHGFRGKSEGELLVWLRRILARSIVNTYARHVRCSKRNVHRDRPLKLPSAAVDESSRQVDSALAASGTSPSSAAIREEYSAQVADRLAKLPQHYREVIILRNLEGLAFDAIAKRMGRSSVAVRQLWTRAIRRLQLPDERE
jgi:RNA polymerase sigma-70 factor (ECF subfamily)